jgi:hypothetical protein
MWVVARYRQRVDFGRTGTAAGHMTIYAQMPDMLALNVLIRHVGAWRLPVEGLWQGSLGFSLALQSAQARRPDHRNDRSSCTATIRG